MQIFSLAWSFKLQNIADVSDSEETINVEDKAKITEYFNSLVGNDDEHMMFMFSDNIM